MKAPYERLDDPEPGTTIELLPRKQHMIEQLRIEAGSAGDIEQVALCDRALAGDKEAWVECKRVCDEAAENRL